MEQHCNVIPSPISKSFIDNKRLPFGAKISTLSITTTRNTFIKSTKNINSIYKK